MKSVLLFFLTVCCALGQTFNSGNIKLSNVPSQATAASVPNVFGLTAGGVGQKMTPTTLWEAVVLSGQVNTPDITGISAFSQTLLDDTTNTAARVTLGVVPKVVLCIIKPDASGVWTLLNDGDHDPFGEVPVISQGSAQVTVGYTAFTKIYGAYAVPDESLAMNGIICGPSVGLTSTGISFQKVGGMGGLISWTSGTTFALSLGGGISSLAWAANELTVNFYHPVAGAIGVSQFDGCYVPKVSDAPNGSTAMKIKFYDAADALVTTPDALCKFCINVSADTTPNIWINPSQITTTRYSANVNVWVAIYGE